MRPTRIRFALVQFGTNAAGEIDVFRLTHPIAIPINVPDSQTLNAFGFEHLRTAASLSQPFMDLAKNGPENVRRAVRFYEEGYSDIRDPVLQLVTWTMGIESACAAEGEILPQAELFQRVGSFFPIDTDVFAESPEREFVAFPVVTAQATLNDIFLMRDRFVHGLWIPAEWRERVTYRNMSNEPVVYVDVLRDAASFILRRMLIGILNTRVRRTQVG